MTLDALCPSDPVSDRRHLLDALALIELGEADRARTQLFAIVGRSPDAQLKRAGDVVIAWSFLRSRDDEAFRRRLPGLPAEARVRLELLAGAGDADVVRQHVALLAPRFDRPHVERMADEYRSTLRTKRPWLAATLSALLPGAGQAYAGSWQAAAVSFVLNATLIGATAELGVRRLYLPAVATGLAASFFYVGNIVNAADLAGRRNEVASEAAYRALDGTLIFEAHP